MNLRHMDYDSTALTPELHRHSSLQCNEMQIVYNRLLKNSQEDFYCNGFRFFPKLYLSIAQLFSIDLHAVARGATNGCKDYKVILNYSQFNTN